MSRSTRMFEIIQLLRDARQPVTAQALADTLEVTKRTVYRDISVLQGMRVPIEGEAGIGYVMRAGFDLPPLMFTAEELEAISVGLGLIARTGDAALISAARRVSSKINDVLPADAAVGFENLPLYTSSWNMVPEGNIAPETIRGFIREHKKLLIFYVDEHGKQSERVVLPLAVFYYIDAVVVAAWCELREDFRHFRVDRIVSLEETGQRFTQQSKRLHAKWHQTQQADAQRT